ncbi:hypothetical protein EMCRGX_G007506 [Ephydatia muelleri]
MCAATDTRHSSCCKVALYNSDLWKRFDSIGTEMVITKTGRRMFPYLKVALSGLQKDELYTVKVEMLLLDACKYRFSSQQWNPTDCEVSDFPEKQRYVHPHSPAFGTQWMLCPVSFKHMKLTNDPHRGGAEDLFLHSMCKYLPRVIVTHLSSGRSKYFSYPETTFIAVTAYQNPQLKALKIITNPYATAFREHHNTSGGSEPSPKKKSAAGVVETNPLPLCPEYIADAYREEHVCWPLDLWPDEHSLYHPALLTPPPSCTPFLSLTSAGRPP